MTLDQAIFAVRVLGTHIDMRDAANLEKLDRVSRQAALILERYLTAHGGDLSGRSYEEYQAEWLMEYTKDASH